MSRSRTGSQWGRGESGEESRKAGVLVNNELRSPLVPLASSGMRCVMPKSNIPRRTAVAMTLPLHSINWTDTAGWAASKARSALLNTERLMVGIMPMCKEPVGCSARRPTAWHAAACVRSSCTHWR